MSAFIFENTEPPFIYTAAAADIYQDPCHPNRYPIVHAYLTNKEIFGIVRQVVDFQVLALEHQEDQVIAMKTELIKEIWDDGRFPKVYFRLGDSYSSLCNIGNDRHPQWMLLPLIDLRQKGK